MRQPRAILWIPLLLLAAAAFSGELGRRDIVTSHEARVAQTAREMAAAGWPWEGRRVSVPAVRLTKFGGISRLSPVYDEPPVAVNPWLVPVMNGDIRLQKPPLPYWCAAVIFRLQGRWSETGARLIPALLGILSLLPLWGLAKILGGRRAAWYAALAWASGYFLIEQFRLAMADPYLAFFTLTAVWAWAAGSEERSKGERRKAKGGGTGAPLLWVSGLCFWLSLALGALAKGPVIFLPVGVAIAAYWLCRRKGRFGAPQVHQGNRFGAKQHGTPPPQPSPGVPGEGEKRQKRSLWRVHAAGFILFLIVTLPWYLYVFQRVPHAMEIWRYESIGELSDNVEKARPWWFYIIALPEISLPWTLVWLLGVFLALSRGKSRRVESRPTQATLAGPDLPRRAGVLDDREWRVETRPTRDAPVGRVSTRRLRGRAGFARRRLRFGVAWYFITIFLFSLLHVKKDTYLLPVMAAEVLIVAETLRALIAMSRRARLGGGVAALAFAQALLGIGFAATVLALLVKWTWPAPVEIVTKASIIAASAIAAALAIVPLIIAIRRRGHWGDKWVFTQAIAYSAALSVFFGFLTPARDAGRSARQFDRQLLAMLNSNPDATLLVGKLPEEASLYLPLNLSYDLQKSKVWVVLDDARHTARPVATEFAPRLRGVKVVSAKEIPVLAPPGYEASRRWRLFEVNVNRAGAE